MPSYRSQDRREYMEPERHDELSAGTPDPEQRAASQERRAGGNGIAKGSKLIPAMGGRARKGRAKLTHAVPDALPVSDVLRRRARYARRKMCGQLARHVGGGFCDMLASALVKLGVEDMAMREQAMTEGKRDEARRLGESARGHFLYAREVCAKDAAARPRGPVDPLAALVSGEGGSHGQ